MRTQRDNKVTFEFPPTYKHSHEESWHWFLQLGVNSKEDRFAKGFLSQSLLNTVCLLPNEYTFKKKNIYIGNSGQTVEINSCTNGIYQAMG